MEDERRLNCEGLSCPQPVIQTKDSLTAMAVGDRLLVIVDNEAARVNVQRFAVSQGHTVQVNKKGESIYELLIVKGEGGSASPAPSIVCETSEKRQVAVYIASEVMGRGDDGLGQVLMKAFVDTLAHFAQDVSHVILVNSGVKLAVEDSPVLPHLQQLEQMGVEVLACGACLNHFQLKDKLRSGTVSNMFSIVEVLAAAGNVLRP